MAISFNNCTLAGYLTRDPELRVTPKGQAICQFGLAVNREYKTDGGESRQETLFINVEAWAKRGEVLAKYLSKGDPLLVSGHLKLDQWEDKTSGQKRSAIKLVLDNFTFLGSKSDSGGGGGGGDRREPPPSSGSGIASGKPAGSGNIDEDVPF